MTVHDSTKPALREYYSEMRRALSHYQVEAASLSVLSKLKTALDWTKIKSVHVYQAIPRENEINTQKFQEWLTANQSQIKIYHPEDSLDLPEVDVVILPVIAFDERGHRLGFGGGTYDKWLASSRAIKIGLAYQFARVPNTLPAEPHDQKLDLIITDQRLHTID